MNRPRFCCTLCPKTFATPKEVKGHFAEKHTEDKPFGSKTFSTKRNIGLTYHDSHRREALQVLLLRQTLHSTSSQVWTWKNPHLRKALQMYTMWQILLWFRKFEEKHHNTWPKEDIWLQTLACDVSFARKAQLKGHNLTHHTDSTEKNFPCPLCNKLFKRKEYIGYHVRSFHSRETPFKCTLCEKSFGAQHVIKVHIRGHPGWKIHT